MYAHVIPLLTKWGVPHTDAQARLDFVPALTVGPYGGTSLAPAPYAARPRSTDALRKPRMLCCAALRAKPLRRVRAFTTDCPAEQPGSPPVQCLRFPPHG